MIIREATPLDAKPIATLHANSWRLAYRDALSEEYLTGNIVADREMLWTKRLQNADPRQHALVLQDEDLLLGFTCVYLNEDPVWGSLLDNLHVIPQAHRQGIGSRLFRAASNYCATNSPGSGFYLWVLQGNVSAQAFYLNYGAENSGSDIWDAPGGTAVPIFRFSWAQAPAFLSN